jgi:hypothetical protein
MAKNKIHIDVKVDDKGSTKKVGLDAKKTSDKLDNLSTSSRTADRNMKGVGAQSSNTSKNFSKMQQGMGGLVGAYASLAAQMFAVSAAFQFFKRAGDLSVLQKGQQAYASATGVAMKSLSDSIVEATGAQITFRDASQAAAIGVAAGLSPEQLNKLGAAAKDVSAVLGRDVTDSFNRLVRGVTKAEPELLDELGIILRLETASKNYANALGLNKDALTVYQKSQAVTNEVLNQAESKYAAILKVTGGGAVNQFNRLGKAMDDVVMSIQTGILPLASAVAKALEQIPVLAFASFGLLLTGPLKAMGVDLKGIRDSARESYTEQKKLYNEMATSAERSKAAIFEQKKAMDSMAQKALSDPNLANKGPTLQALDKKGFSGLDKRERTRIGQGLKAVEAKYERHETVTRGIFKGLKAGIVLDMAQGFKQIEIEEEKMANASNKNTNRMRLGYEALKTGVMSAGAAVAAGAMKLLSWLGWAGIAVTVFQTIRNFFDTGKEISAHEIMLDRTRDKIVSLNEEYRSLLEVQMAVTKQGGGQTQFASAIGQTNQSLSTDQQDVLIKDLRSYTEKYERLQVTALQKEKERLEKHYADLESQGNIAPSELGKVNADIVQTQDELDAIFGKKTVRNAGGFFNIFRDDENILSESEQASKKFVDDRIKEIEGFEERYGFLPKSFQDHLKSLNTMGEISTSEFKKTAAAASEAGLAYAAVATNAKATSDSMGSLRNGLAPLTSADTALQNIAKEQDNLNKILKDEGLTLKENGDVFKGKAKVEVDSLSIFQKEQLKKLGLLKEEAVVASAVNEIAHDRLIDAQKTQQQITRLNSISNQYSQGLIKAQIAEINNREKLKDINAELDKLAKTAKKDSEGNVAYNEVEQRRVDLLNEQKTSAEALIGVDEDRVKLAQDLYQTTVEMANARITEKMLGHEKELLSIQEKRLGLLQRQNSLNKASSSRSIDQTIRKEQSANPFAYLKEDQRRAELELQAAQKARPDDVIAIKEEEKIKLAQNEIEFKLLDMKFLLLEKELEKLAEEERQTSIKLQSAADAATNPTEKARLQGEANMSSANAIKYDVMADSFGGERSGLDTLKTDTAEMINKEAAGKISALDESIAKLAEAKKNLSDVGQLSQGIKDSLQDGLTNAITSIVDGSMKAKDAFKMMAIAVLKQIAAMIAQLMVARMLMSMFGVPAVPAGMPTMPVSAISSAPSQLAAQSTGGINNIGSALKFSTGGVAKGPSSGYPAELHGTEAVVPLPNGKSIPVEMNNGGSRGDIQSNVTVNIANDGTAKTESEGAPDFEAMSKGIAAAVQEELHKQKRSGGILSPYGSA